MPSAVKTSALTAAIGLTLLGAPAMAKDVVKIAFIGPLTGGVSSIGLGGRNSAELAVRLRNADPKSKYTYELVIQDDECKPNVGVQVATKVAADNAIIAGVTHYCSAVAMGTVGVYNRFGLPVVVWGAVLPDITYANNYKDVHRINGTMVNQSEVAAKFMTGLGYKKFAIIHDTTDYGKGHNKYFSEYLKKDGGSVVATFGVTADQQDFSSELTKIRELKPDVIFFGGLTPQGVRIRTQMEKLGITAEFEGTSGIKSDAYIQGIGKELAEGSVAFLEGAPWEKLPGGLTFAAKYQQQKFGEPPEAYGPFAYAAAELIIDAVEKVGPNRKKVREVLNATQNADTIIGKVTFDDHRQNIVPLVTKYVVDDGKWVIWEDSSYGKGKRKLSGL
ncbi:branched-chain amino acid ABC transporter substrate-binding protein [Actimicrobium sp. CCI2.3]|uniref:branched-chain amino acid ABC transporter substrate-binding protein n=1 Tax=Actimicrobium sp. CCI2.3 TaxID=3048616 RepID=UPI002AB3DEB0|nr:branched-chain amino acid ABC transporter substrate-binding protein [Actimicrobium sp. CCI2.3]MDY7575578.1 branched-chain amino acid ABC transporter substrate-binding protein [Actimicrobium sp. CCI2.3]MEB0022841.1 branched-chain amino acid ABC transporter substrate-binding protein [Actimicrobium sp. CCI2.3]